MHARPSWLTAGTQAPVGTVGNGYVYSTFNQPTPIEGTFQGMRGREQITDQFGNSGPGLTLFRFCSLQIPAIKSATTLFKT